MNIQDNFNLQNCCGCTACQSICPKKAISMNENEKGYKVPIVNNKLCVNCGLCVESCDFIKEQKNISTPVILAGRHKDIKEVNTSRSGAFFVLLSEWVIKKGGFVFGCEMIDKNTIIHKCYNNIIDVKRFKGSKYVQSNLGNTFRECKELLISGKYVLFSGTGCQIAGLISFLKISKVDITRLITCDIICHGAPSPGVWRTNVNIIEKKYKKELKFVDFRNKKDYGWKEHFESYYFCDDSKIDLRNWTNAFYSHLIFRDSCYNCKYTSIYRKSDFTIGDCWGIEKINEDLDDNKGVSLIFLNNEKAKLVFKDLRDELLFYETTAETIMQPNLKSPSLKGIEYNYFWKKYESNNEKTFKYFFYPNKFQFFYRKLRRKIYKLLTNKKSNFE